MHLGVDYWAGAVLLVLAVSRSLDGQSEWGHEGGSVRRVWRVGGRLQMNGDWGWVCGVLWGQWVAGVATVGVETWSTVYGRPDGVRVVGAVGRPVLVVCRRAGRVASVGAAGLGDQRQRANQHDGSYCEGLQTIKFRSVVWFLRNQKHNNKQRSITYLGEVHGCWKIRLLLIDESYEENVCLSSLLL